MAKANNMTTMFLNLVLMLSFLLIVSMAEGRFLPVFGKAKSTPQCDSVVGVRSGDTCFAISQMSNMTAKAFSAINPNLNCDALFVGQWLCVAGTAN
ncbi:hypothetical protein VitviT2T_014972 [Vitis vinifera]|uniref:LysM domain-containing protein n=2 Tax=Vitis vinifera TaxID=29760 RepID=A5BGT2_VITVI|nr:hypothetical protein VitviT2T_014972 [Vitis vinifera]CAN74546.1 hypothetical protein VITISV_011096 [Vitis vinifera]